MRTGECKTVGSGSTRLDSERRQKVYSSARIRASVDQRPDASNAKTGPSSIVQASPHVAACSPRSDAAWTPQKKHQARGFRLGAPPQIEAIARHQTRGWPGANGQRRGDPGAPANARNWPSPIVITRASAAASLPCCQPLHNHHQAPPRLSDAQSIVQMRPKLTTPLLRSSFDPFILICTCKRWEERGVSGVVGRGVGERMRARGCPKPLKRTRGSRSATNERWQPSTSVAAMGSGALDSTGVDRSAHHDGGPGMKNCGGAARARR